MKITGPAAGHETLQTAADPTGTEVHGTLNNCAHGYTPWSTYLTCEENWNGYFANPTGDVVGVPATDQKFEILEGQSRYGITQTGFGYRWHEHDDRFRAAINPNEPNRFGYVVEIDPMSPRSMPKKRTALGRCKHENADVVANSGQVVLYTGDDEPAARMIFWPDCRRSIHTKNAVSTTRGTDLGEEINRRLATPRAEPKASAGAFSFACASWAPSD